MKITAALIFLGCIAFAPANGFLIHKLHKLLSCKVTQIKYGKTLVAGKLIQGYRPSIKYGKTVTYECNDNYVLHGASHLRCKFFGKLSGSEPTCRPEVRCTVPGAPANGQVSKTPGTKVSVGTEIEYDCNNGFYLHGSDEATCQNNGHFSPSRPICVPVKCTVPNAPANGRVSTTPGSKVNFGTDIEYSCNSGYELDGDDEATCQANGEFDNEVPTCKKVNNPCGPPLAKKSGRYGTVIQNPARRSSYAHGTKVYFSCPNYRQVSGHKSATCNNGRWYPTPNARCPLY